MSTNAGEVTTLVLQLQNLDVTLPDELVHSADQLLRLPTLRPRPVLPEQLIGLSDEQLTDTLREFGVGHALDGSAGPGAAAFTAMSSALSQAIASTLGDAADGLLDQMRPRFDEAAEAMHAATQLGIHSRFTDRDVVKADAVAKVRDAWVAIPANVRALDAMASTRIGLSRTAGAPPAPRRAGFFAHLIDVEDLAGSMFGKATWREDFEESWQTWLRLSTDGPVRLLTIEESMRAAEELAGVRQIGLEDDDDTEVA